MPSTALKDLPPRKHWRQHVFGKKRIKARERARGSYYLIVADEPKPDELLVKLEQEAVDTEALILKLKKQLQQAERRSARLSRKISVRQAELGQKT